MRRERSNIVLIGMAGSGKSSVGRLLAEMLQMSFVDTDDLIVRNRQTPLQDILAAEGVDGFKQIEEEVLLSVQVRNHVIATGGSSVYSRAGMDHLKTIGLLVLLSVPLDILKKRVGDTSERGLVRQPGQNFDDLFSERIPLYRRYADVIIECSGMSHEQVCSAIVQRLD